MNKPYTAKQELKSHQAVGKLERNAQLNTCDYASMMVGDYLAEAFMHTRRTKAGSFPVVRFKFGGKPCSRVDMAANIKCITRLTETRGIG